MRKLFLHLFVAAMTFFFSLGLTRLLGSSSGTTAPVPTQIVQVENLADVAVEQTQTLSGALVDALKIASL